MNFLYDDYQIGCHREILKPNYKSSTKREFNNNIFESITRNLHFEDETTRHHEKSANFQLVVNSFNEVAATYIKDSLSIDKQILPYKGRPSRFRHYNSKIVGI